MKTLAEHFGVVDPRPEEKRDTRDFDDLVNLEDPKEFPAHDPAHDPAHNAQAFLASDTDLFG